MTKLAQAKPAIQTVRRDEYMRIRDDIIKHKSYLLRKRQSEVAKDNVRLFVKLQEIHKKPSKVSRRGGRSIR